MKVVTTKQPVGLTQDISIFLAGTIDNGVSINWQAKALELLQPFDGEDLLVYNPRNENWDSSMEPVMENPAFKHQVNWEYNALCYSDIILMNFLPDSKSPITLLELGLFANTEKIIMVCPDAFYRRGNVQFTCKEYDIPMFKTLTEAMPAVGRTIQHFRNINNR